MASFTKLVNANTKKENENKYQVLEIDPKDLIDDPDNREVYSEYDIEMLAKDMHLNGVFGTIIAYPFEGGYKIESGHRRKYAAIKAGLSKFPVLISNTPKTDIERRKRLVRANLHIRNYSTMTLSREAEYMYETYEKERDELAKIGQKPEIGSTEQVAHDLEISVPQVSKLRALLKLSPKLQDLIDKYNIPWTPFTEAAELSIEQQEYLSTRILNTIKLSGEDQISTTFIRKEIEDVSLIKNGYQFNRESLLEYESEKQESLQEKKKSRRINGATSFLKGAQKVMDGLDPQKAYIKSAKREEVLTQLKQLSKYINELLENIEENGFSEEFDKKF